MQKTFTKYKTILTILALLIPGINAFAQVIVRGTVKDQNDNSPMPGVYVTEVDNNNRFIGGTVTDADGQFALEVTSGNAALNISFIGYKPQVIPLNGRTSLELVLEEDVRQLETVVVIGSPVNAGDGINNVPIRDLASSVSTIQMKTLEEIPTASLTQALQGRIAGVNITSSSGDPGSGFQINIRGASSLNGNNRPLVVLNGVPYETTIGTDFNFGTADVADYGSLVDISPADIESIQILKDAAAAAIWGSRAANGVVVITTKRGEKGPTKFIVDHRTSYVFQPEALPMLNGQEYVRLMLDARFNSSTGSFIGKTFTPEEYAYDESFSGFHNFSQDTDWVDAVTQSGYTNDMNFSVEGGGQKTRYRTSVGFYDQRGTTKGTGLTRLTSRFNLDYDISDKMRFTTDFSYTHANREANFFDGEWWNRDRQVIAMAYRKAPNMAINEFDSEGNLTGNFFSPNQTIQGDGATFYNPVALIDDGFNNFVKDRIITNFRLEYKLVKGLTYFGNVTFDISSEKNERFFPQSADGAPWNAINLNRASEKETGQVVIQTFNRLLYEPGLGDDHRLSLAGQVSTYDKRSQFLRTQRANFPSQNITDASALGAQSRAESRLTEIRTFSYIFSSNYVWKDKYIIGGGIRIDGDSRFGERNRWGYFPNVSLGWRLSSENFMSDINFLNEMKLRGSFGVNGSPPDRGAYPFFGTYSPGGSYLDLPSVVPGSIQLNNLKWETTTQYNAGTDISLFDYKVNLTIDYYDKLTEDIIFYNLGIPSTSGFSSIARNLGAVRNRGWEFNVNATVYQRNDLNVNFNFNIARNQNLVEEIPGNLATESYGGGPGEYALQIEEGKPIGSFFGFRYLGVYARDEDAIAADAEGNPILGLDGQPLAMTIFGRSLEGGDAIYEDINKDGNIDELDIVYLGDANADYYGGFGPTVQYKNWTVDVFFNYNVGNDIINETRINNENMNSTDNQSSATLRRWRRQGDVTDIPRAIFGSGGDKNVLGSDRFVEDGSFLRLQTVTLSYNFKPELLQRFKVSQMRAYVTGFNLYTFTNYTGQDPEVGFTGNDFFSVGRDRSRTPPPVSITAGVSINF